MGLYFQYCSVLKAAFYWFKFWIKIQQKLELLDGNLRGILHRHLGAVPLCHFTSALLLQSRFLIQYIYTPLVTKSLLNRISGVSQGKNNQGSSSEMRTEDASVSIVTTSPAIGAPEQGGGLVTNTSSAASVHKWCACPLTRRSPGGCQHNRILSWDSGSCCCHSVLRQVTEEKTIWSLRCAVKVAKTTPWNYSLET